jgi:hypothetical protein
MALDLVERRGHQRVLGDHQRDDGDRHRRGGDDRTAPASPARLGDLVSSTARGSPCVVQKKNRVAWQGLSSSTLAWRDPRSSSAAIRFLPTSGAAVGYPRIWGVSGVLENNKENLLFLRRRSCKHGPELPQDDPPPRITGCPAPGAPFRGRSPWQWRRGARRATVLYRACIAAEL